MEPKAQASGDAMSETSPVTQEIIIVRRANNDGEGGHHGGAWKIAYADFVTAMMAFFLVMWLINSANEVTKSRVASYFNPIKMTDATASGRGVKNPAERKAIEGRKAEGEKTEAAAAEKKESEELAAEVKLLQSPLAALDEIVARGGVGPADAEKKLANRSVGDPFDPKAWEALRNGKLSEAKDLPAEGKGENVEKATGEADKADKLIQERPVSEGVPPLRPAKDVVETKDVKLTPSQTTSDETDHLEKALNGIVAKHKSEMDISVTVRSTDEGLLIMLGDNSGQGMFGIGSAKPGAGLVDIVGVIGKLLSERSGDVVIRGHTDNRQYKTSRYDNWQLSTARAHMASYMLIRGGLDERRIKRIEGHGSATPLIATDPLSDSNRRVEFLLQSEGKGP
jgi:chemotaxis protein MotB